jgi:hypothetical protein
MKPRVQSSLASICLTCYLPRTVSNKKVLIATAFQLHFRIHHYEGSGKPEGSEIKLYTSAFGLCTLRSYLGGSIHSIKKNISFASC